ncbi:MAG TPA: O-antigen ligase family protein [Gaiellaceae bacterium]|nr:O-antigen ligase family protein [Gaiellaceae bacterium]
MATSLYAPTVPRRRVPGVSARLPGGFLVAGVMLVALAVGVTAAFQPHLAIAGVLGLALLPVVLARPIVGFGALLFLSFLEEYSALTGALSLTKILGAILVLAWGVAVATARRSDRETDGLLSREPFLAASLVVLAGWAAMSLVWAEAPELAQTSVMRFALNFTLFPIALVAIRTPRHVMWFIAVFVAGAFASVGLGLADGTVGDPEAENRLKGAGINPNQLGSYCVVVAIFAATLAASPRWSLAARTAALAVAGFAGIAVFMTLSRGALVGLAAALVVAPFVIGRRRRAGAVVIAVAAVLGTVGWYATIAPPDAAQRITNPDEGGGSGRVDLWRVGWRMVEDKPVWGVGAGNFPVAAIHYLLRPGLTERDEIIVDYRRVAHNIYLTVLSELGAVGLLLFLAIIFLSLRAALDAARTFSARGDPVMELVARALFLGILSMAVVGFFSSALYSKQFWFLLASGPALRAIAARHEATRPAPSTRLSPATRAAAHIN